MSIIPGRRIARRGRTSISLLAALLLASAVSGCAREAEGETAARGAMSAADSQTQARRGYRCGGSIAPDQTRAEAEIRASWAEWKRRYVTREGAGRDLRVRMPGHGKDNTSSEGIGYGMLLAAYLGDRPTFGALWRYARRHHNPSGLMSWLLSPAGRVLDANAAPDGDEDMALALLVADAKWGGHAADARALIGSLMRHAVEPGTFVPKPGDAWGGSAVTNPSYFAPAYYRVFAVRTGDRRWERVVETSYRVMARVDERHGRGTGLQPEWATAAGDSATADRGFAFHYGYNATRVPWRMAVDAAWHCEPRAWARLERLNAFFGGVGAREMVDGYTLAGRATGRWHNASFVGPALAAAVFSPDAVHRRAFWDEAVRLRNSNYYDDSLRLLALLFASGGMPPPGPPRR